MKRTALKNRITLLLGIVMLGALLFGVFCMFKNGKTASAEEGTVTATLSVDEGDEILAGDTFTLSLTVSTTLNSSYSWCGVGLYYTIFDDQNGFTASQYLEDYESEDFPLDGTFGNMLQLSGYDDVTVHNPSVRFACNAVDSSAQDVSVQEHFTIKIKIKIKETASGGTKIKFAFDEAYKEFSLITYSDENKKVQSIRANDSNFTANDVTITVREKSTDNSLSSLTVGTTAENGQLYTHTSTPPLAEFMYYDYTENALLSSVDITPTVNETHATVYVSAGAAPASATTVPATATPVTSGTATTVTLGDEVRTVAVWVKAESGAIRVYTVTIVDKYAALSALDIAVGTKTDGVTKRGLREGVTFAPDTLTYTVDVPSDYALDTGVTITPTIAEGHDVQSTIALSGTNCSVANNSVASGSAFQVTDISGEATLALTVTASDYVTTKIYVITLQLWSVETGTATVQVQGESKTYESDAEKAAEKKIDYYFLLADEAECKGKFIITAQDGIPVRIRTAASDTAEDYNKDSLKEYGAGTYYISLTAPAGNTKEYVAVLSKNEYLELAENTQYAFLTEFVEDDEGDLSYYRRTYAEMNWQHGVDDSKKVSDGGRVVLGQVKTYTSVNEFLKNISPSQVNMVRLYESNGHMVYNCGSPAEGVDAEYLDDPEEYCVATSWYLQYGGTEDNPLDTVYISVLGDINCDGVVDARDVTRMNQRIRGITEFKNEEVRLAAYLANRGSIAASDVTQLNMIIRRVKKTEDYFYKPKAKDSSI